MIIQESAGASTYRPEIIYQTRRSIPVCPSPLIDQQTTYSALQGIASDPRATEVCESMTSSDGLDFDAVFECLSAQKRREVIAELRVRGPATLRDLVDAVAEPGDRPERVELNLHHRHLPKSADAGLVEYDPEKRVVEPTDRTAAVDAAARAVEQGGESRSDAESARSDRARPE